MRGGQVFMDALVAHGVDAIFGNPGTTENPLLDRLLDYPDINYYVALHESVAVSAASFYAQASGKTGVVNLHVAPGLGNAIGMMYGALKAQSPLVVTAGQQDTRMRLRAPLLSHDLVAMAQPVTKWSAEPQSANEISLTMQRAFRIANTHPKGPVFVALPVNVMEEKTALHASHSGEIHPAAAPAGDDLDNIAEQLVTARHPVIVAGDDIARTGAFEELIALAEQLGAPVYREGLRCQLSFPNRHPNYRDRIPFDTASLRKLFDQHDVALLLGGQFFEELWFDPGEFTPGKTRFIQLEESEAQLSRNFPLALGLVGNLKLALAGVNIRLARAGDSTQRVADKRQAELKEQHNSLQQAWLKRLKTQWDANPMTPARALYEIARNLPQNGIVVDESITASLDTTAAFEFKQPGDYYAGRGGGIGQGVAGALGAQIAHPEKRVVALSGDGSAMYSIQALWSAAHHNLPIVFVILSNREYRVLKHNIDVYRQRFDVMSNKPYPHMDLSHPELGFTDMAQGMGVSAETVTEAEDLPAALERAFSENRPALLDVIVSGKI